MSTQIQRRRGTTVQHSSFTGAAGETTIDIDKEVVVVHDGVQVGGYPQMRENGSNSALALGSAGTPSLKFTGDTNTGIYSPGADQVAISTNGTGRLFIASDGKIGLNVASPTQAQLVVASSAGANTAFFTDGTNSSIKFLHGGGGAIITTESGQYLGFGTSDTERMRLTSAGLLGLGTSSPDGTAHVHTASAGTVTPNSAADDLTVENSGAGGISILTPDASNSALFFGSPSDAVGAAIRWNYTNSEFLLGADKSGASTKLTSGDGVTAVTIDSSQRVGIGTTSPFALLHVKADTNKNLIVQNGGADAIEVSNYNTGDGYREVIFGGSALRFNTGTAGGGSSLERGRFDASGRFLVGTSSSAGLNANLQVRQNNGYAIEAFRSSNDANGSFIWVTKSRGTEGSPTEVLSGDSLGGYGFRGYDGAGYVDAAYIYAEADADWTTSGDTTDNPSRLVFSTTADGASSPTERLRITNLGVPRFFSSDSGLIQAISAGSGTNENIFVGSHSATSNTTGSNCILIKANGNIQNTNNSYTGISDIKLKENIVDAGSQWDDLKALRVVKYNLKPETNQETHTQIGLIAQEVELVCPRLVKDNPDRNAEGNDLGTVTKSVNYSVLYMKAVKALQEAMERIEALEAKVAALEAS
jgi:hypothetical protein